MAGGATPKLDADSELSVVVGGMWVRASVYVVQWVDREVLRIKYGLVHSEGSSTLPIIRVQLGSVRWLLIR